MGLEEAIFLDTDNVSPTVDDRGRQQPQSLRINASACGISTTLPNQPLGDSTPQIDISLVFHGCSKTGRRGWFLAAMTNPLKLSHTWKSANSIRLLKLSRSTFCPTQVCNTWLHSQSTGSCLGNCFCLQPRCTLKSKMLLINLGEEEMSVWYQDVNAVSVL
jgi:hypothetical protein